MDIANETLIRGEKIVVEELITVRNSGKLILENCEIVFAKGAGIFCEGVLQFSDSSFTAQKEAECWNGITLSGSGAGESFFANCVFKRAGCTDADETAGGALTLNQVETTKPVMVSKCNFYNCSGNFGGAVCVKGSIQPGETGLPPVTAIFTDCHFENCTGFNGGAVALISRAGIKAFACVFKNCEAKSAGAVYLYDYSLFSSTGCTFEHCRAEVAGGAISSRFSSVVLHQSLVESCSGAKNDTQGGAYYLEKSNSEITGDIFTNCNAHSGGAIRPVGGILKLERCEFANCSASVAGGAIAFSRDCESKISACRFCGCTVQSSTGTGNVIALMNSAADISDCVFSDCQSSEEAREVSFKEDSSVTMQNCQWPSRSLWDSVTQLFKKNI